MDPPHLSISFQAVFPGGPVVEVSAEADGFCLAPVGKGDRNSPVEGEIFPEVFWSETAREKEGKKQEKGGQKFSRFGCHGISCGNRGVSSPLQDYFRASSRGLSRSCGWFRKVPGDFKFERASKFFLDMFYRLSYKFHNLTYQEKNLVPAFTIGKGCFSLRRYQGVGLPDLQDSNLGG